MSDADETVPAAPDPETAHYLQAFARRRLRLIRLRGFCALVAALLAALTLAAAVDFLVVLDDRMRAALSAAVYLAVAVVVWRIWIGRVRGRPDEREIARLCEAVRPDLREDLLSAVELAGESPADSHVFRRVLRRDVARRLMRHPVNVLLPPRLVLRWLRLALVMTGLVAALALVPGLEFTRLLLRVAIPGLNADRVSFTRIRIVRPDPSDALVLRGEPVRIEAAISGRAAKEVWLETRTAAGERMRVRMDPSAPGAYAADVQMGRESVEYRIRAGDGLTRRHRLEAVDPPQVARFHKQYRYPSYAGLPSTNRVDASGELEGLEGTDVDLGLEVDQAVRTAELRVEIDSRTNLVSLKTGPDGRLRGTVRLEKSGTYSVKLVSAKTGFENRFSPKYEIRVTPDLVPSIEIEQPEKDIPVRPDEIVDFRTLSRDDWGLASVTRMHRVNQGSWASAEPKPLPPERESRTPDRFDLVGLGLKPGDQVTAKYIVRDLKGNWSESTVIKLAVTAQGFRPEKRKAVEARKKVADRLAAMKRASDELRKTVDRTWGELDQAGRDRDARKAAMAPAATAAQRLREAAEQAQEAIREAMKDVPAGTASKDLALAARAVSRTQRETLGRAEERLQASGTAPDENEASKRLAQESLNDLRRAAEETEKLDRAFARMTASAAADVAQEETAQLAREQRELHEKAQQASDEAARSQVLRREAFVAAQAESTAELLREAAAQASRGDANQANDIAKKLEQAAAQAQEASQKNAADENSFKQAPTGDIRGKTDEAANRTNGLAEEMRREADRLRKDLARDIGSSAEPVEKIAQGMAEQARGGEPQDPFEKAKREADREAARRSAPEQLRDRAAAEERRRDADAEFVRDLSRAADAIENLAAKAPDEARAQEAKDTARALQKIEAAHDIKADAREAAALASGEKWEPEAAQALDRSREWKPLEDSLKETEQGARRAGLPNEAIKAVDEAQNTADAERVRNEMNARRNPDRPPESVASPMRKLADDLSRAAALAQPAVAEAREQIERNAPTLAEQMKNLAGDTAEIRDDTTKRSEDAKQNPAETGDLLSRQETLNERTDRVRDNLRRDAAVQDLSTDEGRERARDADDALAMLKQPPPRAEDYLRQSVANPEAQPEALQQAATQQGRTAEALEQLAEHYANLDKGQPEPTRTALRQKESELGVKDLLDQQYAKAEDMAEMMSSSPGEAMAALEQELQNNEAMRNELSDIAAQALNEGAKELAAAAARETGVSEAVRQAAAETAARRPGLEEKARQAAQAAREVAKNDAPNAANQARAANQPAAAQKADRAAQLAGETADNVPTAFPPSELATQAGRMEQLAQMMNKARDELGAAANEERSAGQPAAADAAQNASGKAASAAQQLSDLAGQLRQAAQQQSGRMNEAANNQAPVPAMAGEAGDDISRAGRHEERLGRERGEPLQQIGERTEANASQEVAAASQAMSGQPAAEQAAPAAATAAAALQQRQGELAQAMQAAPASDPAGRSRDSDPMGEWLARALDALDQQQNAGSPAAAAQPGQPSPGQPAPGQPQPGQPQPGQPSPAAAAAQAAMAQAAAAQAAAMAQARVEGGVPGETPVKGAPVQAAVRAASKPGDTATVEKIDVSDWSKLPARMARDLMDAQKENVPEGYREMVDAYFRVVAEEARKEKK